MKIFDFIKKFSKKIQIFIFGHWPASKMATGRLVAGQLIFQIFEKIGKYSEEDGARKKIKQWQSGETALQDFIYNDLEQAVFSKYLYFAPLYEEIRKQFGLHSMLSGSGSASFSLLPQDFDREADLRAMIMDSLGEEVWFCRTRLHS